MERGTEERMERMRGRREEDREQDRAMRAGEDAKYCSMRKHTALTGISPLNGQSL